MRLDSMQILCCPECNSDLDIEEVNNSSLGEFQHYCRKCEHSYKGNVDYIDFMGGRSLSYSGPWERFIRTLYAKIYTPATNLMFLLCGGVKNAKKEVLEHLEITDNQLVLETGIGASENMYLLNGRAKNLKFYGNDIQDQMLVHSIRNLKKWKIKANLFKSDAQYLPFKDESFDVVYHLGSINLFPDKKRAINEMIRVAKPGTKIIIADENQKAARLLNIFTGSNDEVIPPIDLIPKDMIDVKCQTIWRGYGYLIKFRKPF